MRLGASAGDFFRPSDASPRHLAEGRKEWGKGEEEKAGGEGEAGGVGEREAKRECRIVIEKEREKRVGKVKEGGW